MTNAEERDRPSSHPKAEQRPTHTRRASALDPSRRRARREAAKQERLAIVNWLLTQAKKVGRADLASAVIQDSLNAAAEDIERKRHHG